LASTNGPSVTTSPRIVVAVDVGRGQLHPRLRDDPRVDCRERLDIRDVTLDTVGGRPVDLVTVDLSFISLTRATRALVGEAVAPGSPMVLLVKPQFEAGRVEASRGRGVIRDPGIHRRTLLEVTTALAAAGADIMGVMPSPITGSAGNLEFLVHARSKFHVRRRLRHCGSQLFFGVTQRWLGIPIGIRP